VTEQEDLETLPEDREWWKRSTVGWQFIPQVGAEDLFSIQQLIQNMSVTSVMSRYTCMFYSSD